MPPKACNTHRDIAPTVQDSQDDFVKISIKG